MKKHIKVIFAIIVGLLVYLYVNKMFNAPENVEQTTMDSIQTLLTAHHDQIQMEAKIAIEDYYTNFGALEISGCEAFTGCYTIIDAGLLIFETQGNIEAEKGPKELFYNLMFSLNQSGVIQIQDINISK